MACTDVSLSSEQCVFLVLVVTLPYRQVPLHFVVKRQKSERLLHDGREAKREASILNLHVQTPPPPTTKRIHFGARNAVYTSFRAA